jgi:putative ABC transport system ATP-binding protein
MATTAQNGSGDLVYEAIGLKKDFDGGKVSALRGVNLKIRQGEFVAVVGPSGCGKSTLLAMLGCLDKPTAGSLTYRGQSLPDIPDPAAYRAHQIGFVFQAFHLLATYTVAENVQIPMFEGRLSRSERQARALELLKSVGLGHRLTHYPSELSGGERQRVAIARGLANKPSVVLADEPTGNLDSVSSKAIMELLHQLHRDLGVTIVLVTHDTNVAGQASRTIGMKDGEIISDVNSASPTASAP